MTPMSSEHARTFRKPFVWQYYMNEKKFRKNFSQNSRGQQNVTFFRGSKRVKRNFQVHFLTNSRLKTVILEVSFERTRKNYTGEKRIHEKNWSKKKVMTIFLKIFFGKKSKIFKKIFLQKCYFIFKHGEKKKFFFLKKISTQISAEISNFILAMAS